MHAHSQIFGYPTGLGALIIRVDAAAELKKVRARLHGCMASLFALGLLNGAVSTGPASRHVQLAC